MGLDMYLFRVKKINGLTAEDYENIENEMDASTLEKARSSVPKELRDEVQQRGNPKIYSYFGIFDKCAYWRKSNQIHNWFVKNTQGSADDCQYTMVTKGHLKDLRDLCKEVLRDHTKAEELLPTHGGFFFGTTDYDDYYFGDLKETVDQLDKVIAETDWAKQVVLYHSSW